MGRMNALRRISKLALQGTLVYCYYHCFTTRFYCLSLGFGMSMYPTLQHFELIIIDQIKPYDIKKWDMVIARSPHDPNRIICKRVVHLPGERVSYKFDYIKIPKGSVWLEGDNTHQSWDSRSFGPIPIGLLIGKPVLRVWPSIKYLKNDMYSE